jgi:hypothetical protein
MHAAPGVNQSHFSFRFRSFVCSCSPRFLFSGKIGLVQVSALSVRDIMRIGPSDRVVAVVAACFLCFTALGSALPSRFCPIRFDSSSSSPTIKCFMCFLRCIEGNNTSSKCTYILQLHSSQDKQQMHSLQRQSLRPHGTMARRALLDTALVKAATSSFMGDLAAHIFWRQDNERQKN